jgi:hypothetical protein
VALINLIIDGMHNFDLSHWRWGISQDKGEKNPDPS